MWKSITQNNIRLRFRNKYTLTAVIKSLLRYFSVAILLLLWYQKLPDFSESSRRKHYFWMKNEWELDFRKISSRKWCRAEVANNRARLMVRRCVELEGQPTTTTRERGWKSFCPSGTANRIRQFLRHLFLDDDDQDVIFLFKQQRKIKNFKHNKHHNVCWQGTTEDGNIVIETLALCVLFIVGV